MTKIAAFLLMAACTGYAIYAFAQGRLDARPAVAAIGTSYSNGVSFAWLYDATERTVYVCRVGALGTHSTVKPRRRCPITCLRTQSDTGAAISDEYNPRP
jgi:hypothetical protein